MVGAGNPGDRPGVIGRLIAACANHPWMTLVVAAAFAVWGVYAMGRGPLDALPDLSDTQVILTTEWSGQSPDLVEDQVTYPLVTSLLSTPGVKTVRGQSFLGLSLVYVIFEDGVDLYWARSRVLELMDEVRARLPEGVSPTLGPDATGVGWVFQYALVDRSGRNDLQQLRSLQDWNLRYALESVPGVAEVAPVGGFVKQYQVSLDPNRMRAFDVTLERVLEAVRDANRESGGRVLEIAGHETMIRGRGYIRSPADLETVPVAVTEAGTPVTLADVATVQIGPASRRGVAELDGDGEVVGGIVIMRTGENALRVIDAVHERLDEVRRSLPEGVEVVITYDRSELIHESIDTLRHTLIEEMIVVSVIIFLFLLHVRSGLVPVLTLPLAVLLAFIPMLAQKLTINIMSLGGIAIAIGAMVDASVILVENVHKRLETWQEEGRPGARHAVVVGAMQEVGPSIFFSLLVMTVSFLPVFTLQATEGRLFKPLAFTKTYSMGWAAVLAVTVTPALMALMVRGHIRPESAHPVSRRLVHAYVPVVRWVVRRRRWVIAVATVLTIATVPAFLGLSSEFMPPLNEGVLLYMPTSPPGMSVTEAARALQILDRGLAKFPEVESVFGKAGRAETATDPAPLSMMEITIQLKPRSEWREGLTWDGLVTEMDQALQIPGLPNLWWMPIQTRTEMITTGIRSELGIKVFGDDLESIQDAAVQVEETLSRLDGVRSAYAERVTGGFYLDIIPDRVEAARYGIPVARIQTAVAAAIGGVDVTETVEGRERYPVNVRYARAFREDPESLERVLVASAQGAQIPLGQVARLELASGPAMIRSEDGKLVGFVFIDLEEDVEASDFVAGARRAVNEQVTLPVGVRLGWEGQYRNYERARSRLVLIIPLTLFLVFALLYLNTRSLPETGIVLLAVPFSLIGAVWLLVALDYNLSVAVWVGLLALAGLDAETGVVMLLYLRLAHRDAERKGHMHTAHDLEEAIVEGAARRIRPKLMTVLTTILALAPILWSTGAGADVMKRMAAPMVGGLVTSFLLELTVYPAIFAVWKSRGMAQRNDPGAV